VDKMFGPSYCFCVGRDTHRYYDPLQYPLLFPYGNDGYSINMKQTDEKKNLSAMQYYNFQLMIREDNYLLLFRELLSMPKLKLKEHCIFV
jgi:hypothetical protein